MTVPYSFANATVSIPLSQLDANFNTPITLGNTAIQLGNTVTTLNNMTLANVTISSGNVTITNVSVTTANVTTLNAATVIATTANVTTANITTGNVTTANIVTANITTGNVTNMSSGNVAITGGSINGTTLGASTASTANVTTLTTSSTVTINGGTANGVAYLNGSKVLTTGSALTFDGTNMAIGTSPQTYATLILNGDKTALRVERGSAIGFAYNTGTAATDPFRIQSNAGPVDLYTASGQPITFSAGAAEQMRLTSTGLGIGTSSPSYKLDVAGSVIRLINSGATADLFLTDSGTTNGYVRLRGESNAMKFITGNGVSATIDSSGNLGLGVTPPTGSNQAGIFLSGTNNVFGGAGNGASFTSNVYNSSGTWKYATSSFATLYQQTSGQHVFYTAASGTATNNISWTQAMTLDAGGRLLLGTTSSIDNNLTLQIDTPASSSRFIGINRNGGYGLLIGYDLGGVDYANIRTVGAYPLTFGTNNTERARITSGGNLLVGTTTDVSTVRMQVWSSSSDNTAYFRNSNATPYGPSVKYTAASPNNTGSEFLFCEDNTAVRVSLRSNGGIANYSANDVNLSDRREKTNFAPAKSYLDTICAIPVQTFNYIDQSEDDPGLTLGVVAQDVQAVAPELVMESNWGTAEDPKMRLSIYQTDLQYALMKCIQELKAQNDDLRARVAQLEAK